ncbi:hypothetical protein [Algoriphagus boritolerans]|uniref:Uncharacterized protein n=1 Tax=Algoriphagus boritolerans DSM 17298 = JCM 18970 TaxID=1120964 RepID=A0A1H5XZS7_9BACT|nr:hypothetical protein [Algoriphagus boritolerans]SEG16927.1 hypothetical protein SAMN03080598_02730 [Algoriphagus boritolerans DSM 17298 = JCM 18970]
MSNLISIEIPEPVLASVRAHIAAVNAELGPYLPDISPDMLEGLPRMADGREPFVAKAMDFAETNPQFNPPYLDVPELRKDLQAYRELTPIFYELEQITNRVRVAYSAAGSEAFVASLTFYNTVKQAVKVGLAAAKPLYEALRILFERKKPTAQ